MRKDDELTFLEATLLGLSGGNPSQAIENQEKRGQQEVVRKQMLPKYTNPIHGVPDDILQAGIEDDMDWSEQNEILTRNNIAWTKEQYEKMGIDILDEEDDLFWSVKLPEDWEIKATKHHMWNDLYDGKGRLRGKFFYKAAFYDRDAFINFEGRYGLSVTHVAPENVSYDVWRASDLHGIVTDGGTEVIFETEHRPSSEDFSVEMTTEKELWAELDKWIEEHYPNYEDINAYWD